MSLTLTNLKKQFGDRVVINDFSYTFANTGAYALVGKSGSGKTTLLRILAGLTPIDEGHLFVGERIAFAFQEYRLIEHLSVLDNILLVLYKKANAEQRARALDLLERLSLASYAGARPGELSGGMKQRVSLARAFLSDAPILLLDEPFKELDPTLRRVVEELIMEQAKWRLIIFTAHEEVTPKAVAAQIISVP